MFRRRRSNIRYFSRQFNQFIDLETNVPGGDVFGDAPILQPGLHLTEAITNVTKKVVVTSLSWTSDYYCVGGDLADIALVSFPGEEAIHVDEINQGGTGPTRGAVDFTALNQVSAATNVETDFPRRIIHRRLFEIEYGNLNPVLGTSVAPRPTSQILPGFGTERSVRRRIVLRPQDAIWWRMTARFIPVGASGDITAVVGQIFGVVSFAVIM